MFLPMLASDDRLLWVGTVTKQSADSFGNRYHGAAAIVPSGVVTKAGGPLVLTELGAEYNIASGLVQSVWGTFDAPHGQTTMQVSINGGSSFATYDASGDYQIYLGTDPLGLGAVVNGTVLNVIIRKS
jgi:hypothetical protein